jgi:hypothetical protein
MIYGANKQFRINPFKTRFLRDFFKSIFVHVFLNGKRLKINLL